MSEYFVNVWEEKIVIPTYGVGKPEKNPMFFEKRIYQGSSGVVYPNPVIEKIHDEKRDVEYTGLFLENKYLKILVLPELGGRIQMAYDKIKKRHFIYYNHVIKPALVGLCGPWISGGIEFNWPQHHRPSTFEPLDYLIKENADGSKTICVNEIEKMFGMKGMASFTLYPDKAFLEVKGQLYNRSTLPQTFLWWANPALKVNDFYQSVFPPDVNAVFDHGKRDVSSFPIATGTYYKVDYSPGTDISNYKNIPVPTSYMANYSNYDFVGGYENDTKAGLLHVASHHISPGKKQWTWGNGDFGKAWDRNLTDEDGPYIELMTGVYTDNQPDFSWLMPYEEKAFAQYFMPYTELGLIKNANKDILLAIDFIDGNVNVKVFTTSSQESLTVNLFKDEELVYYDQFNCSPENIYSKEIILDGLNQDVLKLVVLDVNGKELISHNPQLKELSDMPEPAIAALDPMDIDNNEQLFLTGLHLEQYRHATYQAIDYYEEALRRDPKDVRSNNALGKWYLRRGKFEKGEFYFREAIKSLTERNPNPYDGEPFYNLGLCLQFQQKSQESYDAFYKATWNNAWKDSSYFSLSQLDLLRGDLQQALDHIEYAIDQNARNGKAWVLKSIILQKKNQYKEALVACKEGIKRDCFNLSARWEIIKIYAALGRHEDEERTKRDFLKLARGHVNSYFEYALDFAAAGLYQNAIDLLSSYSNLASNSMVFYYLGWLYEQMGDREEAMLWFEKAATLRTEYCFPNRLEEIEILTTALEANIEDSQAPYLLGNLWYDKRQYKDAVEMWELSIARDESFPTVFRNLGIAYFNKMEDPVKALRFFEKAFELDKNDARVFMELDQLYKRLNKEPKDRLDFLEQHLELTEFRDDLFLERIALYNFLGHHEKALSLIHSRKFHPWEGGEGKVASQYIDSIVELAKKEINNRLYKQAIEKLENARVYPVNLGEGKLIGVLENDIFYWLGCAYEGLNEKELADENFRKALKGSSEPSAAIFYYDEQPDKIFYKGLALMKLGEENEAREIFSQLIKFGQDHLKDNIRIDYFAVSLPDMLIFEDDLNVRNSIHCYYMMGLGYFGLEKMMEAKAALQQVLKMKKTHRGARAHLIMTEMNTFQKKFD